MMDLTHPTYPQLRPRLARRGAAVLLAGAVTVAGCGIGTDGASGPAQAIEARMASGMDMAVTVEVDAASLDDADARALAIMQDRALFELSVDADGEPTGFGALGALEARVVDGQDVYMRLDRDRIRELSETAGPGEAGDPLAALDAFAAQAQAMLGDQADVAAAFAAGGWVGLEDVPSTLEELLGGQGLGDMLGEMAPGLGGMDPGATPLPFPMSQSGVDDETRALLEEQGLGSIADFLDQHAVVAGDGPWEVTIDVDSVRDALATVAAQGGTIDGSMLEDLDDAPDQVGGITIEAADGVASSMRIDLAEMARDLDEDDPELAELRDAGPVLVVTMTDHTPSEAPQDAVTTSLDEIFSAVIGG